MVAVIGVVRSRACRYQCVDVLNIKRFERLHQNFTKMFRPQCPVVLFQPFSRAGEILRVYDETPFLSLKLG